MICTEARTNHNWSCLILLTMSARSGRNPSSGGRGHGTRGRGHGGKTPPSRGGPRLNQQSNPSRSNSKFHGSCEALKDQIFDCSDYRQADQYVNTAKRISEYVGAEYRNGGDIRSSVVNETKFTIPLPTAPQPPVDADHPTPDEWTNMKLYEK